MAMVHTTIALLHKTRIKSLLMAVAVLAICTAALPALAYDCPAPTANLTPQRIEQILLDRRNGKSLEELHGMYVETLDHLEASMAAYPDVFPCPENTKSDIRQGRTEIKVIEEMLAQGLR